MGALGMFWQDKQEMIDSLEVTVDVLTENGFSCEPPETLYRYCPIKRGIDEIRNHCVHLSSVIDLSDPYDSLVSISPFLEDDEDEEEIDLDEDEEDDEEMEFDDDEIQDMDEFYNEFVKNYLEICCFSETNRSFAMWDHYTSGYKSVCIEYDVAELKKSLSKLGLSPWKVKPVQFKKWSADSSLPQQKPETMLRIGYRL